MWGNIAARDRYHPRIERQSLRGQGQQVNRNHSSVDDLSTVASRTLSRSNQQVKWLDVEMGSDATFPRVRARHKGHRHWKDSPRRIFDLCLKRCLISHATEFGTYFPSRAGRDTLFGSHKDDHVEMSSSTLGRVLRTSRKSSSCAWELREAHILA